MADLIYADIQTLEPGSKVELFELDVRHLGGDQAFFHTHRQEESIWWQGVEYKAFPAQAEGFGLSGEEAQHSPTLTVADLERSISSLCYLYKDLVKARFIRRRTLVRFLDAVNFPEGNPDADPNEHFPDDVYYIEQKLEMLPGTYVKFQMKSALDLSGTVIPSRQVVANVCQWLVIDGYRGPSCGYTGTNYFDRDDNPTSDPSRDACGGRLSSCRLRFGTHAELPFGSYPATMLVRQ